jgi:hypothetical protein
VWVPDEGSEALRDLVGDQYLRKVGVDASVVRVVGVGQRSCTIVSPPPREGKTDLNFKSFPRRVAASCWYATGYQISKKISGHQYQRKIIGIES